MNQNNVEVSCCAFRPIITQVKSSPPRSTAREDQRAKGEKERRREMCALRVPLYKGCYRQLRTLIPPPTTTKPRRKPRRRYSPYYVLSISTLLLRDFVTRLPYASRSRRAVDRMVSALLLSLMWSECVSLSRYAAIVPWIKLLWLCELATIYLRYRFTRMLVAEEDVVNDRTVSTGFSISDRSRYKR